MTFADILLVLAAVALTTAAAKDMGDKLGRWLDRHLP
jgi:hypothetical protein